MSSTLSYLVGLLGTAGVTILIVYFCAGTLKKSTDPGALVVKWVLTAGAFAFWIYLGTIAKGFNAFIVVPAAALSAIFIGIIWAPHIGEILASPFTRWYDGGDTEPELRPLYSIATAYRKRGNHEKSIAEIRRQLARFPEDFEGWLMLAEVYVKDLNDLPEGLRTVDYILTLPHLAPKNAAYVLGRVADWQLEYSDREAARAALERIIERMPDTPEANVAAQRIAHLGTTEFLTELHAPRVIALHHSEERVGLRIDPQAPAPSENPNVTAQRFVDHLQNHPLDNEIREKLAMVYANDFKRLDLATGELEQLIAAPNQTPKNVAHWLNMLADFQVRLANDVEMARETLQRIIELFPGSALANTTAVRMSQLRLELKQNETQKTLKLGSYEQNIGLKRMNSGGINE